MPRRARFKKRRRHNPFVARRGRFQRFRGRAGRIGRGGLGSLRSGKIGEALKGIGLADVIDDITSRFAPQWTSIARPVAGYAGGGILGAVAVVAKDMLAGQKVAVGTQAAARAGEAI